MKKFLSVSLLLGLLGIPFLSSASEVDLLIPNLHSSHFANLGLDGWRLLFYGIIIILLGMGFGLKQYLNIKKIPVHKAMSDVSHIIYTTCKTYLKQQGKFLIILFLIIGTAIFYYFFGLNHLALPKVILILSWSVLGVLWSYGVAWFGVRINTLANSRTTFAALRSKPRQVVNIPLKSGMSIGVLLICVELIMMLIILLFMPRESAGACFIGFAIGESLGASALRIAWWIFTKIADIGSDLMKIVFKIWEDDPRNPGVIADCTGDNAGDSVGPTADGFETYGVTGVALISFIVLAMGIEFQATLIVWIFVMRILMIFTSIFSYQLNQRYSSILYRFKKSFNFEAPLTRLIRLSSFISIAVTFLVSYVLIGKLTVASGPAVHGVIKTIVDTTLRWKLASIISFGTLAAAIIPEFTKIFTSSSSHHVREVVHASREWWASLTILSGLVAGNFSAFWKGMVIVALMWWAFWVSTLGLGEIMVYPSIFAFGLVAFGFLGMGPVTIAVDSYGPVTDNAQSVFELSQIEKIPNISAQIEKKYGFKPDFEHGKHMLEENDGAWNTFKATAKPVLIGTAVIGATTMIFAIILLLKAAGLLQLQLTDAPVILWFITGWAVIYWFSGASMQAVTTWAYRAVEYIKKHINLKKKAADIEDSKKVVKICTQYAQKGMWNIFIVIFTLTLAFAFFDPNFFVSYLISIAVFGLFQAIFMANAGGARDNAKKHVEVDLKEKGTDLHDACVVGDTVGDPFKDTSSVALNPIIKFSTLFGLLAVEIAIRMSQASKAAGTFNYNRVIGGVCLLIGLVFVWRSFYAMRIKK